MNKMFGITGIMVKFFVLVDKNDTNELNNFLCEYDGNIIDIQYQHSSQTRQVMVVYRAFDE